jgi:hypothetical protein
MTTSRWDGPGLAIVQVIPVLVHQFTSLVIKNGNSSLWWSRMIILHADISIQILVYVNNQFSFFHSILIVEPRSFLLLRSERIIQARRRLLFTNHGHWPEWSCSWSGTNNRALPHMEFNRCQLRLNPFANVIPAFTAICSFILFRLAVQYEFVLPQTNEI